MAWHGIGGWAHRSWVEVHRMVMTGRQDIAPIETIPLPLTPTPTSSSVASGICSVFVTVVIIVIIVTLASSTLIIPGGGGGGRGGAVGSPGVRVASHRPAAAAAAASAFARGQRVDTALCSTSA
jgi:hypothetical protein